MAARLAQGYAEGAASQESKRGGNNLLKKINLAVDILQRSYPQKKGKVRLFFEDEASFGRISEPRYCWCAKGVRPVIPNQRVREYREVFGAVEPETGEFFYQIEEKSVVKKGKPGRKKKGEKRKGKPRKPRKGHKSRQMNAFMLALTMKYPNDYIVLVCDRAQWHDSQYTKIPNRLTLLHIPPYTPEMNPIEQLWRELRTLLGNTSFNCIDELITALKQKIADLPTQTIQSITQRDWFLKSLISETV